MLFPVIEDQRLPVSPETTERLYFGPQKTMLATIFAHEEIVWA